MPTLLVNSTAHAAGRIVAPPAMATMPIRSGRPTRWRKPSAIIAKLHIEAMIDSSVSGVSASGTSTLTRPDVQVAADRPKAIDQIAAWRSRPKLAQATARATHSSRLVAVRLDRMITAGFIARLIRAIG
jgi:hypothetical protein